MSETSQPTQQAEFKVGQLITWSKGPFVNLEKEKRPVQKIINLDLEARQAEVVPAITEDTPTNWISFDWIEVVESFNPEDHQEEKK